MIHDNNNNNNNDNDHYNNNDDNNICNSTTTQRITSSTICSICIEDFVDGEKLRLLPRCGHAFHTECILPWLTERQGCCPFCKCDVISPNETSADDTNRSGSGRDDNENEDQDQDRDDPTNRNPNHNDTAFNV